MFLAGGAIFFCLFYVADAFSLLNVLAPLALALIAGAANWHLVRNYPEAIWTPLFSFRLGVLAFFALGSLVPYVVGEAVIERIILLYPYTDMEAAKFNLICFVSTLLVIGFVKIGSMFRTAEQGFDAGRPIDATAQMGAFFFAIGFGYSLAVDVPTTLGIIGVVVPASVSLPFEAANAVGVFLLAFHAFQRGGASYLLLPLLFLLNLALGLVLYNKTLVLFPILFMGLALLVHRVTALRVLAVTAVMVATLSVLQPLVAQARMLHYQVHSSLAGGTIAERIENSLSWVTQGELVTGLADSGAGMSRLSYLNVGTYLISEYDAGAAGETIKAAGWALIPRIIWPDKPFTTDTGSDLYHRLTGQDTSFLSPTITADIYWNLGWFGLLLLLPFCGLAIWFATVATYSIVRRRDWFMMPFVLITFRIGLSVDQAFVIGFFIPAAAAVVALILLRVAKRLLGLDEFAGGSVPASAPS
jgi:hypothetical protein